MAIVEKAFGPSRAEVGRVLENLAILLATQRRFSEAEPLFLRSLAIGEKTLGSDHPEFALRLNNTAALYKDLGRFAEAKRLFLRSLNIFERAFGQDHPDVSLLQSNLAELAMVQKDWIGTADHWRRSTAATIRRVQFKKVYLGGALYQSEDSEAHRERDRFIGLIKVSDQLATTKPDSRDALSRESFVSAQWALSSAVAASLAQMAVRSSSGNPSLARLVRERQDLIGEWQRRDEARTAAVSQLPPKRDTNAESSNQARLAEIEARMTAMDRRLAAEFPDYAALASPAPLSIEQVQTDLSTDEALVMFLDTPRRDPLPEETFIWVVTKTEVRWVRSVLGTPALTSEVAALRCGLDETAWSGEGSARCADLLKIARDKAPKGGEALPFDHARAAKLYNALFSGVRDLLTGKDLLLVPSGPLTQLPFQVLVTEEPNSVEHRSVRWLARDHAITVLPAVSSLKALRRVGKSTAATLPMIGFGNPLLDGNQTHPQWGGDFKKLAAEARARQSCAVPQIASETGIGTRVLHGGLTRAVTSGGLADLTVLRRQLPLPETVDELCKVAGNLKVDANEIYLGARATERQVKALSTNGALARYRIVHFATHGVVAGQLDGSSEPGLILTPPDKATEEDDGYLTASEIAALKLDADWVILSACNTAASGATGAEALSGLARAFFFSGARSLLVSQWEVYSEPTVALITNAVGEIARDPKVGRAEALRRAMLTMIDKGKPQEAHPAYWAPFIVVGEGAATR